ncbi:MAG: protein kinase domain-containing protein, partial [Micromonosporaceae bacterium]
MYVPSELRLIGKLSEDPVAVVHAAHDLGGEPALLVSAVAAMYPGDLEAYTRWAERLVACARHPHIADVVTHGVVQGHPYVAVRTGKRRTLAEQLSGHGPMPYQLVREIGIGLADGLATVHAAGLVHLAIRPSAIFVGDDGGPVLVGFDAAAPGLVRPMASGPLAAPEYHIPRGEIGAGPVVGPPADVYALACCLYLALGGVLPWGGEDDPTVRAMPLPELVGVPPVLLEILRRAVAVHPAHRPSAAQLRDWLATPQAGSNAATPPPATSPADVVAAAGLPALGMPIPLQSTPEPERDTTPGLAGSGPGSDEGSAS